MSRWPTVALGEICEFKYGKSLPASTRLGGDYQVFGSNGVVGNHSTSHTQGETIVVGRKGSFGKVHFSNEPCWPIDTTYFIDSSSCDHDLKWLHYMLPLLGLTELNRSAAIPGLNREDAYRKRMPLPPIEEQRRIAAVLDQVESLRSLCDRSEQLLRDLERSTFSARFGDVSSSTENAVPLLEVITNISSGTSLNCEARPRNGVANEPGILKLSAVTAGTFRADENKAYTGGSLSADDEVHSGDLLMCRKNTKELVGTTALVESPPPNLFLPDLIYRIDYDTTRVTGEFLNGAFRTGGVRRDLEAAASGSSASMANISRARLLRIKVSVPPLEDQAEYASRLRYLKAQEKRLARQLIEIESLTKSLQSRAFRGEL